MVEQAAARQLQEQEERYQAALQQREQQHVSLLQELAALRQLHAEQSSSSINSQAEQQPAWPTQQQQQQQIQEQQQQLVPLGAQQCQASAESVWEQWQQQHQQQQVQASAIGEAVLPAEATLRPLQDRGANEHMATATQASHIRSRQGCLDSMAGSSTKCGEGRVSSPMSSLIAAVLGSGPRATAMQAAHQQRLQQQQEQAQQQRQQPAGALQPEMYQGLSQQLDQMLGLAAPKPGITGGAAAAAAGEQVRSPPRARHDAAAAAVVMNHAGMRNSALAVQHSGSSSCSSNRGPTTPKQAQQGRLAAAQQQQHQDDSSGKCLRCGSDDVQSPGCCCFHPGLVPVPGPLMYSPEWHACRAACTPDAPGCYSRREHYYLPSFHASRPAATAGGSRLGGSLQPGSPSKVHAAQQPQQGSGQGGRSNVSSKVRVVANGRRLADQQQQQHAWELQPRSVLPKPITPKSALRG